MYDLIIIAILILSFWRGAVKGILWQIASIAGLILCFAFATPVSLLLKPYIAVKPPLDRGIAIFIVYVVGSFAAFILARGIRSWLEKIKFDAYDRHLGGMFGLAKGIVICLIVTFFAVTLTPSSREAVMHSHSGYAAALLLDKISPVLPTELKDLIDPHVQALTPEKIAQHRKDHPRPTDSYFGGWLGDKGNHDDGELHPTIDPKTTPPEIIINALPGLFSSDLRGMALQAMKNTSPEDRGELMEKLKTGVPGLMQQVVTEWMNGKPKETAPIGLPEANRIEKMLKEIAGVYFPDINAQDAIVDQIKDAMEGLPSSVSYDVYSDWHADFIPNVNNPDPDPGTDAGSSLDMRILRQLQKHGVAVRSLEESLQHRLLGTVSR